jgi:hypothetical protein
VACPGIPVEGAEVGEVRGPHGIQVEVADQLEQIGRFLHHEGRIPVLEEVTHSVVAAIEGPPHGGVSNDRMLRARGRLPVRTRGWA